MNHQFTLNEECCLVCGTSYDAYIDTGVTCEDACASTPQHKADVERYERGVVALADPPAEDKYDRAPRSDRKRREFGWFNWFWNRGRCDKDNMGLWARQKSWRRVF